MIDTPLPSPALLALLSSLAPLGCGDDDGARDATSDVSDGSDATPDASDATPDATPDADDVTEPDGADAEVADTLVIPPDREPGARTPRTARCDDIDPERCFLPWPSNAFVVADASTATGLRVSLATDELPADEGLDALAGDGFSRVTPIVARLPLGAPAGSGRLRVFVAEPGPDFGREVAVSNVRFAGRDTTDPDALVAYPLAPLVAASEHLVVLDEVADADGPVAADRTTRLALGLVAPADADEAARVSYFAPARAIVLARGLDATGLTRVWDFTTRSADDPRGPLRELAAAARAAVADGSASVVVEGLTPGPAEPSPIAAIVVGHLEGLPDTSAPDGRYSVPFRVVVPRGEGDYHVVMYGHGTGGDVSDKAFDALIAGAGAAKVNTEIDGWTGDTVTEAVAGLLVPIVGTRDLVVRMRRAIAGIAAIQAALAGPLGDALAAATVAGSDNPTAGRRPRRVDGARLDQPVWAGGSLGGVIGMVYGHLEPTILGGVLNVPGAGFTHWLGQSALSDLLSLALASRYPAMIDQQVAAAMAQQLWDGVDGAAWAKSRDVAPIFLVQMSVGDPIMPNLATALVSTSLDAVQVAPVGAAPMVPVTGLEQAPSALGRSGLTEFRTDLEDNLGIHGFADTDRPAGVAARDQIAAFVTSLWAGAPRIDVPPACLGLEPAGVCDFSRTPR